MRFIVQGVDRETAKPARGVFDAENERAAAIKANDSGIVVSAVSRAPSPRRPWILLACGAAAVFLTAGVWGLTAKDEAPTPSAQPKLLPLNVYLDTEMIVSPGRWRVLALNGFSIERISTVDRVMKQIATPAGHDKSERELLEKLRPALEQAVRSTFLVGLFYLGDDSPIAHLGEVDGETCLLLSGLTSDTVYNSGRLSEKQRAAQAAKDALLPSLDTLATSMLGVKTDVKRLGIVYTYGSRNFAAQKNPRYSEGETLCIVASISDLREHSQAKITREELLRRSMVLLRGSEAGSTARIELTIE